MHYGSHIHRKLYALTILPYFIVYQKPLSGALVSVLLLNVTVIYYSIAANPCQPLFSLFSAVFCGFDSIHKFFSCSLSALVSLAISLG